MPCKRRIRITLESKQVCSSQVSGLRPAFGSLPRAVLSFDQVHIERTIPIVSYVTPVLLGEAS